MEGQEVLFEPNLIGEYYRKVIADLGVKFHNCYDNIDVNSSGVFALSTSDLFGRIWAGSVWLFTDVSAPPDDTKCLTGLDFNSGVAALKWLYNEKNIVVGLDSGEVNILTLGSLVGSKIEYFTSKPIACDHDDSITSLDVSFDSSKLVSASRDMSIKILDVENATTDITYTFAHSGPVSSVSFNPGKSHMIISTSDDGDSLMWDTKQERPASQILNVESGFTASCWIDDNFAILGATSGLLYLVDLRKKEAVAEIVASNRPIHYITLERSSQRLAVCADDPVVRVYDCSEKDFRNIYKCERHKDFVRGLCWKSPNNLYSCGFRMDLLTHDVPRKDEPSTPSGQMEENDERVSSNSEEGEE